MQCLLLPPPARPLLKPGYTEIHERRIARRDNGRIARRKKAERIRAYVQEIKDQSVCKTCGTKENLTFHHRCRGEKKGEISKTTSWVTLLAEIEKCDILREDCHQHYHTDELRHESEDWKWQSYLGAPVIDDALKSRLMEMVS